VHCIELGAEDYLQKPFDPVLLRARIRAGLDKRRLLQVERARVRDVFWPGGTRGTASTPPRPTPSRRW
jgi:DNA-binding response OmpR family regulator